MVCAFRLFNYLPIDDGEVIFPSFLFRHPCRKKKRFFDLNYGKTWLKGRILDELPM